MSPEDLHAIELLRRVPYGRVATSMRALPFLALARHIVVDGDVMLRMHAASATTRRATAVWWPTAPTTSIP